MDLLAGGLSGRLAEYERLAEQVAAMRAGIQDVRATEFSADGLVTAVVGGRGELLELELDPRIYRDQNAAALAESIVDTVHAAAATAEREAVRLAKKLLASSAGSDRDVDPMFDPASHLLRRRG